MSLTKEQIEAGNESFFQRLVRIDDGRIMRGVFYILLAAVGWTLYTDYVSLRKENSADSIKPGMAQPILPPFNPTSPADTDQTATPNTRPEITSDPEILRRVLKVQLSANGVLNVTGTVDPGSSERFSKAVADVSEYVKIVALNSPGGSVRDALAISKEIREKGFNTKIDDGALCASSCPIIFAGGVERVAGAKAAIGVHQVYTIASGERSADREVSGAQTTIAQIGRHLHAMGVDDAVWLHALETPPRQLYYLNNEELKRYKLATKIVGAAGS